MANPQLEDGHTRIANEILDAFCRAFPGGANAQVLLAIIRATYGWHKKEDKLSISQIEMITGLSRRSVIYALQNLETQRFITVQRQRGRGNVNQVNTVSFQKNHDLWVVQRKSPQYENQLRKQREKYQQEGSAKKKGSAKIGQKVVQRKKATNEIFAPTKDNIQKIITKEKHGEFQNVLLTTEEYQWLKDKLGEKARDGLIEKLSAYMKSRGRSYKDHYATILNWSRRDNDGQTGKAKDRRLPARGSYTRGPDYGDD